MAPYEPAACLSVTPRSLDALPAAGTSVYEHYCSEAFAAGESLLASIDSWTKAQKYLDGLVLSRARGPIAGETYGWQARTSVHTPDQATYDELRANLLHDHAPHAKDFLPTLRSVELIRAVDAPHAEAWLYRWSLPWPMSPREFAELHIARETSKEHGHRSFMVLSLPVEHPVSKDYVRGDYTSVERLSQIVKDGKPAVEWIVASSANGGGRVPGWLANQMSAGFVDPVQRLLEHIKAKRSTSV